MVLECSPRDYSPRASFEAEWSCTTLRGGGGSVFCAGARGEYIVRMVYISKDVECVVLTEMGNVLL